jgi:hypothetical protein
MGELLGEAERAARDSETWADLSNFLFNPVDGLVARAYPTREAREAFIQTAEYRKIRQLVSDARERHGLVEGATPKKLDRLVIQIPQSLHATLEREAVEGGVSLNELILAKLGAGPAGLASLALEAEAADKREKALSS